MPGANFERSLENTQGSILGREVFLQEVQVPMLPSNQPAWPFPERPKPPCSMRELIALGLFHLPNATGSCQQVIEYITAHFPYYRQNDKWHHSLQTYMADKRFFDKAPKRFAYNEYLMKSEFRKTVNLELIMQKVRNHMDNI